jgi:hypothetical protein
MIYLIFITYVLRYYLSIALISIPPHLMLLRMGHLRYPQRLVQVRSGLGIDHRYLGCRRGSVRLNRLSVCCHERIQ